MTSVKLGSKIDAFQQKGQSWFCTTGLPSDLIVEVDEMSFHLHKFPLLSRSGVMERMITEATRELGEEKCIINLSNLPGSTKTFELVAKFCYGMKLELTASNIINLRCAAEHLEMTEEYGEGNLITQTENFLNRVVLRDWKDSLQALQACNNLLSCADELNITKRCIDSLAMRASVDPNPFGWPIVEHGGPLQSPGGSLLWNGISTGARLKNASSDWWFEDVSVLTLPLYKRLISAMVSRGIKQDLIAGSLTFYAKRYLPGVNRRRVVSESTNHVASASLGPTSEEEQRTLLEEIDRLLPMQKCLVPTKFLFGLLRTATILQANPSCVSSLERRIGMQLDQATLEDLLMPNLSHSMETLYNVDLTQRLLEHFMAMEQTTGGGDESSPCSLDGQGQLIGSPSLTPITMVAKLIDGYLAEIAPDINLKLPKFQALAGAVPDYARPLDDGLYRAIDIYLKSHPWLAESEREQLCRLMDCQKLSLEACTHAAQNERLPLRVIVQVLFFEQLQLRTSIAGCFLVSDNLDGGSQQLRGGLAGPPPVEGVGGGWASAMKDNQVLKLGMDSMRTRVSELEKECSNMRLEIEKLGGTKGGGAPSVLGKISRKFALGMKSQMCSAKEGSVSTHCTQGKGKDRHGKHKKSSSSEVQGTE
ncbi:hypothetical protein SAY86_028605 [Trapa natans]|uniref:Uncharacterized protein n=1 Tax=Trapa natans TaxID=22666 RepID=A0AAN7R8S5_TRANT|nr:hypothetical protein SAY86_028605 [Trapa natans]